MVRTVLGWSSVFMVARQRRRKDLRTIILKMKTRDGEGRRKKKRKRKRDRKYWS